MSRHLGERDTIAAIATAVGPGAIGIVRISGPAARSILERLVGGELSPRRLTLRDARSNGELVDQVLAVWMPGPASYTGEDSGELQGHGGPVSAGRLLRAVVAAGARQAEPGEFTRRAFENGRIDLTQAEGLLNVISAASDRAQRVALELTRGRLGDSVRQLRARVVELLASIEASIDFPEDDIDAAHTTTVGEVTDAVEAMLATSAAGAALGEGVSVALVGGVNVGKSSLFNRLVGRERSVVAPEPGTTRDYVEAIVVWDGLQVTLIDTAGDRAAVEAIESVEARGVALGLERAATADLQLVITPVGEMASALSKQQQRVWSKGDLGEPIDGGELVTSAVDGRGLEALKSRICSHFMGELDSAESVVVVSGRQRSLLEQARKCLGAATQLLAAGQAPELVAVELREARSSLSTVLGDEVGDEMLDELFARFCIGK
jgi:tRNA modification GTPase